ncbi:MAG: hypothetical protein MI867_08535 [Pseudomonadales bacterium]|nr:hypothetical protein [Pseudomonadales bacterium]
MDYCPSVWGALILRLIRRTITFTTFVIVLSILWYPSIASASSNASASVDGHCDQLIEFPFSLDQEQLVVPYPNNLFTRPANTNTGIRLNVDKHTPVFKKNYYLLAYWLNSYNKLDGFGVYGEVFIPKPRQGVSESLTETVSRTAQDGVFLMVADPSHRFFGEIAPARINIDKNHIRLTPLVPLLENTRYVAVATQQLRTDEGVCLISSSHLQRLIESEGVDDSISIDYQQSMTALSNVGIEPKQILSLAEFNTLSITPDMDQVKDIMSALVMEEAPTFWDWEEERTYEGSVSGFVNATLATPSFRNFWGVWQKDRENNLNVQSFDDISVLISLPDNEVIEYQQPYPLVIYAHGTNGNHDSLRNQAQLYAEAGFAGVSMDSFCHGDRSWPNADDIRRVLCYYNFMAPLAWRDNGRESAVGYLWLKRAIQSLAEVDVIPEGGDGIPDFDVDNIYFMGISLGSLQGGVFVGSESDIRGRIFGVGGARFSEVAYEHQIVQTIRLFARFIDRISEKSDLNHLVYLTGSVFQSILDASDPGVYIYYQRKYQQQFVDTIQIGGAFDRTVSGASGAALARAGGWPQMIPYVWDAGTEEKLEPPYWGSGFFQYDTSNHGFMFSDEIYAPTVRAQLKHFLRTSLELGQSELIFPLPD